MTSMARQLPFICFSIILVVMGLFPAIGNFFASIPEQVGYVVLLVVLCQIVGRGLQEYVTLNLNNRDVTISGLSLLVGVGVMFLPFETFLFLDTSLRIVLGNGLIVGLLVCIILDRLMKKQTAYSKL